MDRHRVRTRVFLSLQWVFACDRFSFPMKVILQSILPSANSRTCYAHSEYSFALSAKRSIYSFCKYMCYVSSIYWCDHTHTLVPLVVSQTHAQTHASVGRGWRAAAPHIVSNHANAVYWNVTKPTKNQIYYSQFETRRHRQPSLMRNAKRENCRGHTVEIVSLFALLFSFSFEMVMSAAHRTHSITSESE